MKRRAVSYTYSALFWPRCRSTRRWSSRGRTCANVKFKHALQASSERTSAKYLRHVCVPPVRVFLGQRRQDPRACRDTSALSILLFIIIITRRIIVITPRSDRGESSLRGRQLKRLGARLLITPQTSTCAHLISFHHISFKSAATGGERGTCTNAADLF